MFNLIFYRMKRMFLLCLVMFLAVSANAQSFICTKDYVTLRTGPGEKYPAVTRRNANGQKVKVQIFKGEIIETLNSPRNGYYKISLGAGECEICSSGWIPAKYLKSISDSGNICQKCGDYSASNKIGPISYHLKNYPCTRRKLGARYWIPMNN